jgi:hypothetical protein
MRKVTWTALGIAAVSLLLCGSGELLAQVDTATSPADTAERDTTDTRVRGTAPGDARVGTPTTAASPTTQAPGTVGTGGTAGDTGAGSAELRRSVLQLQSDMARMSQELAQVRAELADLNAAMGVGGSGQAGAQGTAPRGNATQGTADRGTAARGTQEVGEAVVNAIYTGTVRSVSVDQLVLLDEDGQAFTVELGERTRVYRDGKRITARQLEKGTRVRATVDLLAGNQKAMEIVTVPNAR